MPTVTPDFTARLNLLFDSVYPLGRCRYSITEVAALLQERGIHISVAYLSQLCSGSRKNPSASVIDMLATFFRVDREYFTDEFYYHSVRRELQFYTIMRDEKVRRLGQQFANLSPLAQQELMVRVEELRKSAGLAFVRMA